jgi:hypothetical protein
MLFFAYTYCGNAILTLGRILLASGDHAITYVPKWRVTTRRKRFIFMNHSKAQLAIRNTQPQSEPLL